MKRQKEYIFLHAKTFTYNYSVCQGIVQYAELIYLYWNGEIPFKLCAHYIDTRLKLIQQAWVLLIMTQMWQHI